MRNKKTLIGLICKYIKPNSTIYSDCWSGYVINNKGKK